MNIELIEQLIDTKEFSQICEDAERGNRNAALFINKFMKVENLQNDLENLLKELGINKKNEIEIINPSKRNKDSEFYYDKESIEIVKNQDKYIFNKFNY